MSGDAERGNQNVEQLDLLTIAPQVRGA